MSIFKCKMCGGTIEFEQGATVGVCDSCGTKQTLPRLDDDRRANLYDRANHFRRNNEFDKAMGIYEQILNEDNTDAEAYWSLVLCRYGIEYVEDPATHRRIPTVNRAQFTSIFDDDNYQSAMRYADPAQKALYYEETQTINEIQKGILQISQKEEPFDVFICYKETDSAGRRTPDSVLANDLYHQLTQEGFKVFFSRITLENKLGTAYEPYIFAALNSAKVMVVLGTRPEYFNAVWVKNEWARYLALIKNGAQKTLIPAYKDMDPYDLPDEFSHLQALDMSKLGFMQDLIRGIKKISEKDQPKVGYAQSTAGNTGSAPAASLLRRAFMFLEDGNWQEADQYCEKVLDMEPENARAYLGKLMAELQVKTPDELANQPQPFDNRNNYQKAFRFGDEKLRSQLTGYIQQIRDRLEYEYKVDIYNQAIKAANEASGNQSIKQFYNAKAGFKNAAELFRSISGFQDADILVEKCLNSAEICDKDALYKEAQLKMKENAQISDLKTAIENFQQISGWRDSDNLIGVCMRRIDELKAWQEADRIRREQQAEAKRIAAEKAALKRKRTTIIVVLIVILCIAAVIIFHTIIIPKQKKDKAMAFISVGDYESAYALLTEIGNDDLIKSNKNDRANEMLAAGNYEAAYALFAEIGNEEAIKSSKHNRANEMLATGNYEAAYALFAEIGNEEAIKSSKYDRAAKMLAIGEFKSVYMLLNNLHYKDSDEIIIKNQLQIEKALMKDAKIGDYVVFGSYEQDNNTSNGKEVIEWQVLEQKSNSLLLISRYLLDCKPYNIEYTDVTWEKSTLRAWLNGSFLKESFSAEEQVQIPTMTISADKNPKYDIDPGQDTLDKIFLLSINEAELYFSSNAERQVKPTVYAESQGAYTFDSENARWTLRSPGGFRHYVASINSDGSIFYYGNSVKYGHFAVRPALWVNLDSENF